jgi:hypothetical protein
MAVEPTYVNTDINGEQLSGGQRKTIQQKRVKLDPFAQHNWKTLESRDKWKDTLQRASAGKSFAEWKSVESDKTDRKAAIIHINNYNREEWLRRLSERDLVYRDIRYSEPYEGFSHKFFPTSIDDPERNTYAVIAQNEDIADKIEEAELEFDEAEKHRTVGGFLGFPDCCIEHFLKTWHGKEMIDPMYETSCNTPEAVAKDDDPEDVWIEGDIEPWANVLWRYFGWSFITHIPCSWSCEESLDIGRKRGEIMAENGFKDEANALWEWLGSPHVWTGKNSIAHIRNRYVTGQSGTSSYWSKKRIVWKREHEAGGSIL